VQSASRDTTRPQAPGDPDATIAELEWSGCWRTNWSGGSESTTFGWGQQLHVGLRPDASFRFSPRLP
jgi:hypothetical protein